MTSPTPLITPADRIFVAGHRGMAGSAILRALAAAGYGDPAAGGSLLTASRSALDGREQALSCSPQRSATSTPSCIGPGVRLVEKLVIGRYSVGRNGNHFDLQKAALDLLITDGSRQDHASPSSQQKPMAELLGSELLGVQAS